jgi:copper chaperone CopZ
MAAGVVLVGAIVGSWVTARTMSDRRAQQVKESAAPRENTRGEIASIRVLDMTCEACVPSVKSAAKKLDGVLDIAVSYKDGLATAAYDPAKVTPDQIARAIAEQSGFRATVVGAKK